MIVRIFLAKRRTYGIILPFSLAEGLLYFDYKMGKTVIVIAIILKDLGCSSIAYLILEGRFIKCRIHLGVIDFI